MNTYYKRVISLLILTIFAWISIRFFHAGNTWKGVTDLFRHPFWVSGMLLIYFLSFCLKAAAWQLYLSKPIRFSTALYGIVYSLFINHLIPIKAGDIVRAKLLSTRENHVTEEEAFHSVVVLRLIDMILLLFITSVGLFSLERPFFVPKVFLLAAVVLLAVLFILFRIFPSFMKRHWKWLRHALAGKRGIMIISLTWFSWLMEASIIYGTIMVLYGGISVVQAVFANSLTVAGQVFQITPGGIGNYESFLIFGLRLFDFTMEDAYTAALLTHGLKFAFSYAAGFLAWSTYPLSVRVLRKWILWKEVE